MALNILVAFDDSENAQRAVDFLAKSFGKDSSVTLFHVLQDTATLCEMHSPELTDYFTAQQSSFCALEDQKKRVMEKAMETARGRLQEAGFQADRISLQAQPKNRGVARDIAEKADAGYDVIVAGRRGISAVKEFFMGSVSQKLLHAAKKAAVVIVN